MRAANAPFRRYFLHWRQCLLGSAALLVLSMPAMGIAQDDDPDWSEQYRRSTVRVFGMKLPSCEEQSSDDESDDAIRERCQLGLVHGSGFAFTPSQTNSDRVWIVTNRHIVDRAQAVAVQFSDDARRFPAEIKYVDDTYDVALLGLVVPDDVDASELGIVDGSVLSRRLLSPDNCRPPQAMNIEPLETSADLHVAGFPYDPDQSEANVAARTYRQCHSDPEGRAYLQMDESCPSEYRGGPVFDDAGRLLGMVVSPADGSERAARILPSGGVVRATSEYDRNEWKWRPSTNSVEAYSSLARAAAEYLAFLHSRDISDDEAAEQALRTALRHVTEARTADSTYAASYLFWAGLLWRRMGRSAEDASREYASAAFQAVQQAKRHGGSFDEGTRRFIATIERIYYQYRPDEAPEASETSPTSPDPSSSEASEVSEDKGGEDDGDGDTGEGDDPEESGTSEEGRPPPEYLDARFQIGPNSLDGEIRSYEGRIRAFVWERWITLQAGYERRRHLVERHTDDILVDYGRFGAGTAPILSDEFRMSVSSGVLAVGASSFLGGYLELRLQYGSLDGVGLVLKSDSRLLKTPDSFGRANLDEIYPGISSSIDDVTAYARPSTLTPHTDSTLEMHYGDAQFDGYLEYHGWSPTTRLTAGGGLLYNNSTIKWGIVFKFDRLRYGSEFPIETRRRFGGGTSFAVDTKRFAIFTDYLYWAGKEGRDEHAIDVGLEIKI